MHDEANKYSVAYLSMEIALENNIKTYAGGLGVLAGDILRSAASLDFPMVGITLLNDQGYFQQEITPAGEQIARPDSGYDFSRLEKLPQQVTVPIGTENVRIGIWRYLIKTTKGFFQPVYFLDANLEDNSDVNRKLTGQLYGGDEEYRLKQEIILGRGGLKMLDVLGYKNIKKFHLNEGHGSLAAIELFLRSEQDSDSEKVREVRNRCLFTIHTPLLKQQESFSLPYFLQYQPDFPRHLKGLTDNNEVNLNLVGLFFSNYVNAVSQRQKKTLNKIFPHYRFKAVTNGVNSVNWVSPEFQTLYDKHVPGWRTDGRKLTGAKRIPLEEIWSAHQGAKRRLINQVNLKFSLDFKEDVLTLVFARRFTSYKRPELMLSDIGRLLALQDSSSGLQIIYAGKAHPDDLEGQALIKQIYSIKEKSAQKLKIVFWEDYDLDKARLLTAGADLWVNTPLPPHEASGTSGMKAAHNGISQLSTLDGWWPEGYVKNKTGWALGQAGPDDFYDLLGREIIPVYYQQPERWKKIMRRTISRNAAVFNTDRVIRQYIKEAYKMKY